jgi:xanthine dehydrogenase accessory factor
MLFDSYLVIMRGGGDLATGVAYRLNQAGFPVIALELARPLVVRRRVSLATAVLEGEITVEGLTARLCDTFSEAFDLAQTGIIPLLVSPNLPADPRPPSPDPHPLILLDCRMAKRNIDTRKDQADLVVALGPGFTAGQDCHAVIETMRGHHLGRVLWTGSAIPNTGTPGIIAGKGAQRVLRAPVGGIVDWRQKIGDRVHEGQYLGSVNGQPLTAPFDGVIRGLIAPSTNVPAGLKIGDVDARAEVSACFTISDKALAVGGGVLEAILSWLNRRSEKVKVTG